MYLVHTSFDSKAGNRVELLDAYRSLISLVCTLAYVFAIRPVRTV